MKEIEHLPLEKLTGKERKSMVVKHIKKVLKNGTSKEVAAKVMRSLFLR